MADLPSDWNGRLAPSLRDLGPDAMPAKLRNAWSRLQPALLSLVLIAGGMGGPIFLAPECRSTETEETVPASERGEEFAAIGRFDHERQMKLEQRHLAITFEVPSTHLGHA